MWSINNGGRMSKILLKEMKVRITRKKDIFLAFPRAFIKYANIKKGDILLFEYDTDKEAMTIFKKVKK